MNKKEQHAISIIQNQKWSRKLKLRWATNLLEKKFSHWKACVARDDAGPCVPLYYFHIKKEGENKSFLKITGIVYKIWTVKNNNRLPP